MTKKWIIVRLTYIPNEKGLLVADYISHSDPLTKIHARKAAKKLNEIYSPESPEFFITKA